MHYMGKTIEFDDNKCIKCTKCVSRCNGCSVGYLEIKTDENGKKHLCAKNGINCIHCGQCTLVCPVNAIRSQPALNEMREVLKDKSKVLIVQCAPSIRASIGEGWKMEHTLDIEKKMNTAFRLLGFNKVFDVNFGADITTMVEAKELVERLNSQNAKLPMFTSCCHAWVEYALKYHPELRQNLTTARSPHLHSAGAYKTWWAKENNINAKDIIVVSIMPCTSKKEEILEESAKVNGMRLVDYSLTEREIIQLIKENNIDFPNLEGSEADSLADYSGAGVIYGASGGVMESALRTAYKMLTGEDLKDFNLKSVRTDTVGFRTAEIDIKGRKIKVAVVSTPQNVEKLLLELKDNPNAYQYVEVMACAGGCIGGGGMPLLPIKPVDQIALIEERRKVLYGLDEKKKNERTAHSNPMVQKYMDWVKLQNDSLLERDLYHTKFEDYGRN
jgi:iron-only hydrogenase group A